MKKIIATAGLALAAATITTPAIADGHDNWGHNSGIVGNFNSQAGNVCSQGLAGLTSDAPLDAAGPVDNATSSACGALGEALPQP